MQLLVPLLEPGGPDTTLTLRAFCAGRKLSLRSRIEIFENVCALVYAAHATQMVFSSLTVDDIEIEYVDGTLSIELPEPMNIGGDAARNQLNAPRDGQPRFTRTDVMRAANVISLGHVLKELTAGVGQIAEVGRIIERSTTLHHESRFTMAELCAEATLVRTMLYADDDRQRLELRDKWSWA